MGCLRGDEDEWFAEEFAVCWSAAASSCESGACDVAPSMERTERHDASSLPIAGSEQLREFSSSAKKGSFLGGEKFGFHFF